MVSTDADPARCAPRASAVFVDPAAHAARGAPGHRHAQPGRATACRTSRRYIVYGASPRASINLIIAARALAFVRGRTYVIPQDVTDLVHDVMRHRIIPSYEALSDGVTTDDIIQKVMQAIPAPAQVLQGHAAARV